MLLAVAILVALGLIGAGVYLGTESLKKSQAENRTVGGDDQAPVVPPVRIEVSAAELEAEYKANEVRADSQYRGKPLRVRGVVDRISRDIRDEPHVILKSTDYIGGVVCSFGKSGDAEVMNLSRGVGLVLDGVGAGYALGGPMMRDCEVERVVGPTCLVPNADSKGITVTGECLPSNACHGSGYYKGVCAGPADIVCCAP